MNNILNKIAQMERNSEEIQLASHHVELGLADTLKTNVNEDNKNIAKLDSQIEKAEKQIFLEKKLANFPSNKKEYMVRVLSEKKMTEITENFNYVSDLYDKKEENEIETLRESAQPKTKGADVTRQEEVVNESKSYSSAEHDGSDFVSKAYVSEFTKKAY